MNDEERFGNLPALSELTELIKSIQAGMAPPMAEEEGLLAEDQSMCVTVGWSPETGAWSYQTGDNSFTGGAYGLPIWGVGWLTKEDNPEEFAHELRDDLLETSYYHFTD